MRDSYRKVSEQYLQTVPTTAFSRDEVDAIFTKRILKFERFTDGQIEALGDLSKISDDRLAEIIEKHRKESYDSRSRIRIFLRKNWETQSQ